MYRICLDDYKDSLDIAFLTKISVHLLGLHVYHSEIKHQKYYYFLDRGCIHTLHYLYGYATGPS